MGHQTLSILPPVNMSPASGVGMFLLVVLLVSLMIPNVESKSLRPHRVPLARRGMARARSGVKAKMGKRKGARRGGYSRKGKTGRRGGRDGHIPDSDVVTDDVGAAMGSEAGAGGDVCEVLMFDRGDGTYSLKFVKNNC